MESDQGNSELLGGSMTVGMYNSEPEQADLLAPVFYARILDGDVSLCDAQLSEREAVKALLDAENDDLQEHDLEAIPPRIQAVFNIMSVAKKPSQTKDLHSRRVG